MPCSIILYLSTWLFVHECINLCLCNLCLCNIGNVRLIGGSGPHEGRVEILFTGQWGTVCDDFFDLSDAVVVCRQLGYPEAMAKAAYFGQGSGPIWLENVHCVGTETSLHHCRHNGFANHNCGHDDDVGVVCEGIA